MTDKPYHHGSLRPALLAAALRVVECEGQEAVSLRSVAASLGVSRAAPYRHFPDRIALLAAVAGGGFRDLLADYARATAGLADPTARLRAIAETYLDFAARRPRLFALMSTSDLFAAELAAPDLLGPANEAYALRERAVAAALPGAPDSTIKARTIGLWSTLQGFAILRREHRLKPFMLGDWSEDALCGVILDQAVCSATA